MTAEPLAAAILVGGRSRRMGTDKALLTLAPDGPPVVETVARILAGVAAEVVLVGGDAARLASLGLPWLPDRVPGAGPLAGIHAALAATTRSHVLVVACDMPFLNLRLLRHMAALPRDYDVLVPVLDQPQPLHAIYARTCLPLIEQRLQAGAYKVTGWFSDARLRAIERPELQQHDPSLRSCFNLNTPQDLALARQLQAAADATSG